MSISLVHYIVNVLLVISRVIVLRTSQIIAYYLYKQQMTTFHHTEFHSSFF